MNDDYKRYERRVRYLTECNLRDVDQVFDDRFNKNIDHIFPIRKGYEYGIPERLIASTDNLQVMDRQLNRKKGSKIYEIPDAILEWLADNEIVIDDWELTRI